RPAAGPRGSGACDGRGDASSSRRGSTRRGVCGAVTASRATAAVTGCQRTAENILPLFVPNAQLVPGVAAWFATVCRECPAGCGVIAKNSEGRVVKLEGNPDHPVSEGALRWRGTAETQRR